MPLYKRKRVTRRKPRRVVRPKRGYRNFRGYSAIAPRKAVSINRAPVSYSREFNYGGINIPIGSNQLLQGFQFTLQQLIPNYAEFTSLFDQYRLKKLVFKLRLVRPPEANNTSVNQQYYPDVYCSVDHDDSNAPTTVDQVQQYGKCKTGILKPNYWFKYRCYPTASAAVYRALATAYMPIKNNAWLDLAYTDIPYYGIKLAVDVSNVTVQTDTLSIECRIWSKWEFKNSR